MDRDPEQAPDLMLICPACGIEPAVLLSYPTGLYCDHCQSIVTPAALSHANPSIAIPAFPAPGRIFEGGHFRAQLVRR